nr:probable leucine-rich repeat receptor-like protein kinase At1g35710 [Arachis hypogaea]
MPLFAPTSSGEQHPGAIQQRLSSVLLRHHHCPRSSFSPSSTLGLGLLCYNQLTGSIPTQLGDLKKLSVLALQSNELTSAIPASLGDLGMLMRLDLSSNQLFGSIPSRLADVTSLQVLDVHNNTLSGNVAPGNNDLLMLGFSSLRACNDSDHVNPNRPEPYGAGVNGLSRDIPETANVVDVTDVTELETDKTKLSHIIKLDLVYHSLSSSMLGVVAVRYNYYQSKNEQQNPLTLDGYDSSRDDVLCVSGERCVDEQVGVFSRVGCSVDRRGKHPHDENSDADRFVGERSLIAFLVGGVAPNDSVAETAGCSGPRGRRP